MVLESKYGAPKIVNDGVTVAKEVNWVSNEGILKAVSFFSSTTLNL